MSIVLFHNKSLLRKHINNMESASDATANEKGDKDTSAQGKGEDQ